MRRDSAKGVKIITKFRQRFVFPAFFGAKRLGLGYAAKEGVMPKSSNNNSVEVRCEMAEPTKFIVRCCELRKMRTRQLMRSLERQQSRDRGRD